MHKHLVTLTFHHVFNTFWWDSHLYTNKSPARLLSMHADLKHGTDLSTRMHEFWRFLETHWLDALNKHLVTLTFHQVLTHFTSMHGNLNTKQTCLHACMSFGVVWKRKRVKEPRVNRLATPRCALTRAALEEYGSSNRFQMNRLPLPPPAAGYPSAYTTSSMPSRLPSSSSS